MTNDLFNQAVALSRAGRKDQARELFIRILELNPMNESAWLWYADTLSSLEDRKVALKECLQMIPDSQVARRGLEVLQGKRSSGLPTPSRPLNAGAVFTAPPEDVDSTFLPSVTPNLNSNISVSPFTVSPDSLTDADLAAAESNFLSNIPPGSNSADSREVMRRSSDISPATRPISQEPNIPSFTSSQLTNWSPTFSDDAASQQVRKPPTITEVSQSIEPHALGSDWGSLTSLTEGEQELAPSWMNAPLADFQPVQHSVDLPDETQDQESQLLNDSKPTETGEASPAPKETRESQILFYLGVGIVVVLVLLVAILLWIFSI